MPLDLVGDAPSSRIRFSSHMISTELHLIGGENSGDAGELNMDEIKSKARRRTRSSPDAAQSQTLRRRK